MSDIFEMLMGEDWKVGTLPELSPSTGSKGTLQQQFESFHKQNPHILRLAIAMALKMKREGWGRASMRLIWAKLRFEYAVQTRGDKYKLNDHHTPFYARVIMGLLPELDGFFEVRVRKGKDPYVPDWDALEIDPSDYVSH